MLQKNPKNFSSRNFCGDLETKLPFFHAFIFKSQTTYILDLLQMTFILFPAQELGQTLGPHPKNLYTRV